MIDTLLFSVALATGNLEFEERPTDVRLLTRVFGMKVTLSAIPKSHLAALMAQTADGTTAPVDTTIAPTAPQTGLGEPPSRQKPMLKVVTSGGDQP